MKARTLLAAVAAAVALGWSCGDGGPSEPDEPRAGWTEAELYLCPTDARRPDDCRDAADYDNVLLGRIYLHHLEFYGAERMVGTLYWPADRSCKADAAGECSASFVGGPYDRRGDEEDVTFWLVRQSTRYRLNYRLLDREFNVLADTSFYFTTGAAVPPMAPTFRPPLSATLSDGN
jgi:hypothetical protein